MVVSSNQISGLIGGQQVMFSNYAAHAQQITNIFGTGPQQQPPSMQPPFPQQSYGMSYDSPGSNTPGGIGGTLVGGAGLALPGMAAGASMLGGMVGGKASVLDPWTMGYRAFGMGSGAGGSMIKGAGLKAVVGGIGQKFATQGLMGGMGAIAGGAGAAAMTALPYYAAAKGIGAVGEHVYQGAQNIGQVGDIMGRQGSFQGQIGGRTGGGMSRGQIRDITSMLREVASEDTMVSMREAKNLMDVAQRSGALSGVMNADQFKTKFRKVVDQVKGVAEALGTSLEEAMPLFNQAQGMGLWKTADIMGMTQAIQTVGRGAAPHLMQTMQSGAQMSHARGGALAAGAATGRQMFMNVQSATKAGLLPEEAIREFTGGVGGARGQQMMAQKLTGTAQNFAQSSMGRLMMAGLGEFKEGAFTGKIDQERMGQFMGGEIGIDELQRVGQKRAGSRRGAASYTYRSGQIGQEMIAKGGMEGITKAIQAVTERFGPDSSDENIQGIFIQKLLGTDQREAETWRRMAQELPAIMDKRLERQKRAIDAAARRLHDRKHRSWRGLKDALGHVADESWRPVEELAETAVTKISQGMDELTNRFYGKETPIQVTAKDAARFRREGGLTSMGGMRMPGGGPDLQKTYDMSWGERITRAGEMSSGVFDFAEKLGGLTNRQGRGSEFGAAISLGAKVEKGEAGTGYVALDAFPFNPYKLSRKEIGRVKSQAASRARDPTLEGMGYKGIDNAGAKKQRLAASYTKFVTSNWLKLQSLRKETKGDEASYQEGLIGLLEKDPEFKGAARDLLEEAGGGKGGLMDDALAIAQKESKTAAGGSDVGVDFKKVAVEAGALGGMDRLTSEEKISAWVREGSEKAAEMLEQRAVRGSDFNTVGGALSTTWEVGVRGATSLMSAPWVALEAVSDLAGGEGVLGVGRKLLTGEYGLAGWIDKFGAEGDMSSTDLMEASQKEWGAAMAEWVKKGAPDDDSGNEFLQAAREGDVQAKKALSLIKKMKARNPQGLSQLAPELARGSQGKALVWGAKRKAMLKTMAGKERAKLEKLGGGLGGLTGDFKDVISKLESAGNVDTGREKTASLMKEVQEDVQGLAEKVAGDEKQMRALGKFSGGVLGQVHGLATAKGLEGEVFGGGTMSTKAFERRLSKISKSLGYDVRKQLSEGDREELEKAMKSGGGVSAGEIGAIQEQLEKAITKGGPAAGAGTKQSQQEKLLGLMTEYAGAHQKFVWAVGRNIDGMEGKSKDLLKQLEKLQQSQTGVTPKGAGQNSKEGEG